MILKFELIIGRSRTECKGCGKKLFNQNLKRHVDRNPECKGKYVSLESLESEDIDTEIPSENSGKTLGQIYLFLAVSVCSKF